MGKLKQMSSVWLIKKNILSPLTEWTEICEFSPANILTKTVKNG